VISSRAKKFSNKKLIFQHTIVALIVVEAFFDEKVIFDTFCVCEKFFCCSPPLLDGQLDETKEKTFDA
jgi:hypothetical protein